MAKYTKKQLALRERVYQKSEGHCIYCGCPLDFSGKWHMDHVYAINRITRFERMPPDDKHLGWWYRQYTDGCMSPDLDREENLYPACAGCNIMKSSHSLEGFRAMIEHQYELIRKKGACRILERMGMLDLEPKPVVFWYEQNNVILPTYGDLMGFSAKVEQLYQSRVEISYRRLQFVYDGVIVYMNINSNYKTNMMDISVNLVDDEPIIVLSFPYGTQHKEIIYNVLADLETIFNEQQRGITINGQDR